MRRTRTFPTGEWPRNANTGECLACGREVGQGGCQRNRAMESSRSESWLGRKHGFQPFLRQAGHKIASSSLEGVGTGVSNPSPR